MRPFIFLVIVLFLNCTTTISQNSNLNDQEKIETILNKLWEAKGLRIYQKPSIQFFASRFENEIFVAKYNPSKKEILIGRKAYKNCMDNKRSESSLAILIGHELGHFFQDPNSSSNEEDCFFIEDAFFKTKSEKELDADFKGVFNAYLAGYNVVDAIDTLFTQIYTTFKLEDKGDYPPLEVRLEVAIKVMQKVNELIALYETANIMMAIGHPDLAIGCYKKILLDFQSKEMYNNLGLAYLLKGIQMADQGEFKFIYPVEVDVSSLLIQDKQKGFAEAEKLERKMIFNNALLNFDTALNFDPFYESALLNRFCLFSLYAVSGGINYDPDEPANIHYLYDSNKRFQDESLLLEGIRLAHENKIEEATIKFQHTITQTTKNHLREIAEYNLKILNEEDVAPKDVCLIQKKEMPTIESPNIFGFSSIPTYSQNKIDTLTIFRNQNSQLIALRYFEQGDSKELSVSQTSISSFGQAAIGELFVNDRLDCFNPVLNTNQGTYFQSGIFFIFLGHDGYLKKWGYIDKETK